MRGLLERCFLAERLDGLFGRNAQEQYTRYLLFSTACDMPLLAEAGDWRFLARLSPAEFAQWLRDVASGVNTKKYKKHGRGPKKPQQKTPHDPKYPPVSTQRLRRGARTQRVAS